MEKLGAYFECLNERIASSPQNAPLSREIRLKKDVALILEHLINSYLSSNEKPKLTLKNARFEVISSTINGSVSSLSDFEELLN